MNFPKILNFCPLFDQILGIFLSFWSILHAETANSVVLKKNGIFLCEILHFYQFPSISPSNTSGRKTLPFCRSCLILAVKLEMRKNPFKRNPYLRDKTELTNFSLKSRFHCTILMKILLHHAHSFPKAIKTWAENCVLTYVIFCLRSLVPLERCAKQ